MSITASLAGAVILLVRFIHKIPRRVIAALWCIPALRMLIPFAADSRFSLVGRLIDSCLSAKRVALADGELDFGTVNYVGAAASYDPITYKTHQLHIIFNACTAIWATVVALLLLFVLFSYLHAIKQASSEKVLQDNTYFSAWVSAPAVFGICKPKILLPHFLKNKDNTYILLHERAHIRRKDNLWRLSAIIVACVHWFNPLAWIYLRFFLNDLEQACDETVLAQIGKEKAPEYARALVDFAEQKSLLASAFGGGYLKGRVKNILSYRRVTLLSGITFFTVCAILAAVLLTN